MMEFEQWYLLWKTSVGWCSSDPDIVKKKNTLVLSVILQQWFIFWHQSGLVTISPVAATCALALLYLRFDNHKEWSGPHFVSYLQRLLTPVRIRKLQETLNRLKTWNVGQRFYIILSKQNQRENEKMKEKRQDILVSADLILHFGQCPTGLLWSRLSHSVRPSPAARRPLPATQTVRENMTSPLYHSLDTLEAHSSAGSNAPCRWRLMLTHWSKRSLLQETERVFVNGSTKGSFCSHVHQYVSLCSPDKNCEPLCPLWLKSLTKKPSFHNYPTVTATIF